jgi:hypothetical protein
MIKKGIYCSQSKTEIEERHGGVKIKDHFYHHLCFYVPERLVGFYGGSRLWLKPYEDRDFIYQGLLTKNEAGEIAFSISGPATNDRWLFNGNVVGNLIHIKAIRVTEPTRIWLEDTFEYIGPMGDALRKP